MGLFGGKKIYVSSVVYNLAGDENSRPNYLKTIIFGAITSGYGSVAETISGSYLNGPGMKLRSFARWARNSGYSDLIGMDSPTINLRSDVDTTVLAGQIPHAVGESVVIQNATINTADYTYWADQFMLANHPTLIATDYRSDLDEATNKVTLVDAVGAYLDEFFLSGFEIDKRYIYATYNIVLEASSLPPVDGPWIELDEEEDFPDTSGWTLTSSAGGVEVWERTDYLGQVPGTDEIRSIKYVMTQEHLADPRRYKTSEQTLINKEWKPSQIFIYREGSGNAILDAMFSVVESADGFFPVIPFRIDNQFVSSTYLDDIYPEAKRAFRRSVTGRFDKMIGDLEDNDSLGDIDYAYTVFGVSLNTKENAAKRYIYTFFKEIMLGAGQNELSYLTWKAQWEAAEASQANWNDWKAGQEVGSGSPHYGTPEPATTPTPAMPNTSFRVTSKNRPVMNFDFLLSWWGMDETISSGLGKPGAKKGDFWFEALETDTYSQTIYNNNDTYDFIAYEVERLRLYWQDGNTTFRYIDVWGLQHQNLIYGGKSIDITGKQALLDPEESGFIIPLQEGIYRRLPLVVATQMATACSYMMFNCYQVVKQKWYETGIFKIIIIIIAIIIAVVTGGTGSGLLGSAASVGGSLGFTGLTAIVVGAAVNAIAAMILMSLIQSAATKLFGEKLGALIGAIVAVVAVQVGTAINQGASMSGAFSGLMNPDNLLKLTAAGGGGYAQYLNASTREFIMETNNIQSQYKSQSEELQQMMGRLTGMDRGYIDPMMLTNAVGYLDSQLESASSFLGRTLMTGSEIAELSLNLITNFSAVTLSTELQM